MNETMKGRRQGAATSLTAKGFCFGDSSLMLDLWYNNKRRLLHMGPYPVLDDPIAVTVSNSRYNF